MLKVLIQINQTFIKLVEKVIHSFSFDTDLWSRFFRIDATLLCEFESDKI